MFLAATMHLGMSGDYNEVHPHARYTRCGGNNWEAR